jgi:hypothetical protein
LIDSCGPDRLLAHRQAPSALRALPAQRAGARRELHPRLRSLCP